MQANHLPSLKTVKQEHALTTWGVDIFILLEPSDSCLCSHFILHASMKKMRENWINRMWRGMWRNGSLSMHRGAVAAYPQVKYSESEGVGK